LNAKKTVNTWRNYASSVGIEKIHLCAALTHGNNDYKQFGFDSGVEFPPHNIENVQLSNQKIDFYNEFWGHVIPYELIAKSYLERQTENQLIYKTVFPSWDNTARRNNQALIIPNGTPKNYEYWLSKTIEQAKKNHKDQESFVFINAWNEWAEGCHLEPDRKYGRQFLEATQRALNKSSDLKNFTDKAIFEIKNRKFLTDLKEFTSYHTSLLFRELRSYISKYPRLKAVLIIPIRLLIRLNSSRS
jgi:lipopolysaccharide biosynthesis protein